MKRCANTSESLGVLTKFLVLVLNNSIKSFFINNVYKDMITNARTPIKVAFITDVMQKLTFHTEGLLMGGLN